MLLEEAVLRRYGGVEVLIDKGADIYRIINKQIVKDEQGKETIYGRTLLHLAVYPPQKARGLLYQHKWKKIYDWLKEESRKNKNPIPLARQEAPAPEVAMKEAAEKELHTLKINEYIDRINSWNILDHLPSRVVIEQLLKNGLGSDEINMKEMPNSNSSPYDIIRSDYEEISGEKSLFYKEIKEKNYFPIGELFEEKCGITDGIFHRNKPRQR
jgi:hypothetical protein